MTIFQILQVIIFSSIGISVCFALFINYYTIRYGNLDGRHRVRKIFEFLRGRKTILVPLKIFSWIALISWISLVLPFFDFLFGIDLISNYKEGVFTTWCGSFSGKQSDYYGATVFFGILCSKGFLVIHYITDILSDTTLSVKSDGQLGYHQEL